MSLGVVVGDLMAVAEVGDLWGEADGGGRRRSRKIVESCEGEGARVGNSRSRLGDPHARLENPHPSRKKPRLGWGTRSGTRSVLGAGEGARSTLAVTGKRLGEVAEAAFMAKAAALGFGVSKTWGDSDRYDFIVDGGAGLWRVQVKSAHRAGEDGGYSFRSHGHSQDAYRAEEIDALVAYVVPEDAWYVFPAAVFVGMRSLKLFGGSRRRRSKFERYREAWEILRGGEGNPAGCDE